MPRLIVGEFPKQIETSVARLATRDCGVRFIDDDHLRACAQKVVEPPFAFYEVEADDSERVGLEDADRIGKVALQPRGSRRRDRGCGDRKFGFELRRPLIHEMRRAKN